MGSDSGDAARQGDDVTAPRAEDDSTRSRSSKFRFKSKHRSSRHHDDPHGPSHRSSRHGRQDSPSAASAHHRTKRRRRSASPPPVVDDPALYDDTHLPNASSHAYMTPEAAFRESLFDALADDEGAAFWEGVYGQPIHTYPAHRPGPDGELERMTDDEYAAYVRACMYEKTHQHVIEERQRREEAARRRKESREQTRRMETETDDFDRAVEESLRRGRDRSDRKSWKQAWEMYMNGWEEFRSWTPTEAEAGEEKNWNDLVRRRIPWPVKSGQYADVKKGEIEAFFKNCTRAIGGDSADSTSASELTATLKIERVRWHPDKIQQRLGSWKVDERTMRIVTAVFQVVDGLWADLKAK